MTLDSSWAVQAALYEQLIQSADLTALLADGESSVFDHVPSHAAFPYIVIGDMSARQIDAETREVSVSILSFSRGSGMKEVKSVMSAVLETLQDTTLSADGHNIILCQETGWDASLDADGITRKGVQRFRLITEPV